MLTDFSCKALIAESKRRNKPLKKSAGHGLFIHAFPNGTGYWYHKYVFRGQVRQISYGRYPLVSLLDARQKRDETYRLLQSDTDPVQLREELKNEAAKEKEIEFEKVARNWHTRNLKLWSPKHAKKIIRRLERRLFKRLGRVPVSKLGRKQLVCEIRRFETKSPSDAQRCVQDLIRILEHAKDEEFISVNVAQGMERSLEPQKHGHYASMKIDELSNFLMVLHENTACLSQDRLDAIELLMLTAVRGNELIQAEWSEFDFESAVWTIPPERMKMSNEHIVPLSKQAMSIFKARFDDNFSKLNPNPSKFVFPSRIKPKQPLAHNTISYIIIDMGYKGKHTGHGFRALFMGIAKERLKYAHDVPDRQLAHMPRGEVDRAYDRAEFLDDRIKLMQEYADYIDGQKSWAQDANPRFPLPNTGMSYSFGSYSFITVNKLSQ